MKFKASKTKKRAHHFYNCNYFHFIKKSSRYLQFSIHTLKHNDQERLSYPKILFQSPILGGGGGVILRKECCVNLPCSLVLHGSLFQSQLELSGAKPEGSLATLCHNAEVWTEVLFHHISTLVRQSLENIMGVNLRCYEFCIYFLLFKLLKH